MHRQANAACGGAIISISWSIVTLVAVTACSSDAVPSTASGGGGGTSPAGGAASAGSGIAGDAVAGSTAGTSAAGSPSGGTGGGASGSAAGGSSSGAGGARVADCHQESDDRPLSTRLPCALSQTGLYAADMVTLAEGVHPYAPRFELWSDGALKKRWIALPPSSKIDTSDMDYWTFPVGTKLWKEFTRDGVRVETRLIEKQASGSWYTVAYQWRPDQKEADAVPNGVIDASGTTHDIPNSDQCLTCHSQIPDKVLGFSAIQLSHDALQPADSREWTLATLAANGVLTQPPPAALDVPGTDLDQRFFGYLHANCGHCHNPKGTANSQTGLDMWLKVADLTGPVTAVSVYKAILDTDIAWLDGEHPNAPKRIAPGSLPNSAVYQRFIKKGEAWSMPPLGTELVDPVAKKLMEDWIATTAP
jgi:hypothetical protein